MTHRVHPYIFRLGELTTWKSRWLHRKKFREYLREDTLLRAWLDKRLREAHIASIDFERSTDTLQVILKTARPGILIGRGGEGAERLKKEIQRQISKIYKHFREHPERREVKLTIEEVRKPELYAAIVARMIADDIEKRVSFRRAMRQSLAKLSQLSEVQGAKIALKGRLDGSEMARYEWVKHKRIPLQTIRADIDYAQQTAYTTYGTVGIKVWIYKGDVFDSSAKFKAENSK